MRKYRVVMAATKAGLQAAAGGWTILVSTVREFSQLETFDDHSLGDIGGVFVGRKGFVCLAYNQSSS